MHRDSCSQRLQPQPHATEFKDALPADWHFNRPFPGRTVPAPAPARHACPDFPWTRTGPGPRLCPRPGSRVQTLRRIASVRSENPHRSPPGRGSPPSPPKVLPPIPASSPVSPRANARGKPVPGPIPTRIAGPGLRPARARDIPLGVARRRPANPDGRGPGRLTAGRAGPVDGGSGRFTAGHETRDSERSRCASGCVRPSQ
jgi:hypothetical protein